MRLAVTLTLTPTDLTARELRADHAQARRLAGERVWAAPQIQSLRQWIEDSWADGWPAEQRLSQTQLLALWQTVVEREQASLLSPLACARLALAAERLCAAWRIDPEQAPAYTDEHQAFRRWRRQVHARMQQHGWVAAHDLPARLAPEALASGAAVELRGFDHPVTPAEQAVLDALTGAGRLHAAPAADRAPGRVQAWTHADAEAQFRGIAALIRTRLAAAGDGPLPRILLAVPDPEGRRVQIEDALVDLVAPWLRLGGETTGSPWRWVSGPALAAHPWATALAVAAQLSAQQLSADTASALLLCPGLWRGEQRLAAAATDLRLRETGWPHMNLAMLRGLAAAPLQAPLEKLAVQLGREPARALPSAWSGHFRARLDVLGWPGEEALPSAIYQTVRTLEQALDRLGTLDALLGPVPATRARQWLMETLRQPFQPRADHPQPLLIGRPEDFTGLDCELLIVCDASADSLPGPAGANPFIAVQAQRAAGVPEAAPDTWLAWRSQQLQALARRAGEVLYTLAVQDERGAQVRPSPLLGADWQPAPPPAARSHSERSAEATQLVWPASDPVPPLGPAETTVRGDVSLFKHWFASPFVAFCSHRLGVRSLPARRPGLSALVQGQLLHAALADFWGAVQTREALRALDAGSLARQAAAALAPHLARALPEAAYGPALVRLETARLNDLLHQWLQHELRRVHPFTVIAREQALETRLGALPVSLRLDRADRVDTPDGPRILLIDYKTGSDAPVRGWDADRLSEPQLPLYALLAPAALDIPGVDGIAFAHLLDGHPALSARTRWAARLIEDSPLEGDDWDRALAEWTARLNEAASGFCAGWAGLDRRQLQGQARLYRPYLDLAGSAAEDDGENGDEDEPS